MQYIFYFFVIIFLYLNYKIIASSLKKRLMPNKYLEYLLILLPLWILYIFLFPLDLTIIEPTSINFNYMYIIQIILSIIVSFALYYFWLWSAGDAKYVLVLSLFIPYLWIITFIWNTAILALIFLILYFLWFYFWKCLFNITYSISLWKNIINDLKNRWFIYRHSKWWNNINILSKWLFIFFIFFVSIRLIRTYIFEKVYNNFNFLTNINEEYYFHIIILVILFILLIIYLTRLIINRSNTYIINKFNINTKSIKSGFIILLIILLLSYIINEYLKAPSETIHLLYIIFTLYLFIYLVIKIIIYSYKISFWISDTNYINLKKIEKWSFIDKKFLINIFWTQKNLEKTIKNFPLCLYNLENPITEKWIILIKKIYKDNNTYHKKIKTKSFQETNKIKILIYFYQKESL